MNDTTTQTEQRSAQLVMLDQQLALGAYLHALLKPAEETAETPAEITAVILAEPAPVVAEVSTETPAPTTATEPMVTVAAVEASPYPDWAAGDFQCLLFRVAGLTLALPLAKLNGVLPWDAAAVTVMPGHRPWFLGLREYQGQQVQLIDVANVVIPRDEPAKADGFGKVILIGDGRWGLACDAIAEVVTLAATAVKWRGRSGNRPWLAGTVIERMCALIDADAFAEMLGDDGPLAA